MLAHLITFKLHSFNHLMRFFDDYLQFTDEETVLEVPITNMW